MTLKNDSTKHNWRHPVLSGNNLAPDNSSVTLTVLNPTTVQLAVDKNGDGTIDETTTTTWSELNSLL